MEFDQLKKMIAHPKIGEILIQHRKITLEQLALGLDEQENNNTPIGRILIEKGFITENELIELLSIQKNIGTLLKESYIELEKLKSENPEI